MAPPRRRPLRGGPACRDPRSACHRCPTEHAHDHRSRCPRGEQGRDDVASQLLASGLRRSRAGAVVCSSVRQRPVAAADWTAFTLFVPVPHHATAHASQLLDPDRMGGAGPQLVGCPGLRGALRRHLRRCRRAVVPAGRRGYLGPDRMGRGPAVEQRQGRHARSLIPGGKSIAGRLPAATEPGRNLPLGGIHRPLNTSTPSAAANGQLSTPKTLATPNGISSITICVMPTPLRRLASASRYGRAVNPLACKASALPVAPWPRLTGALFPRAGRPTPDSRPRHLASTNAKLPSS